VNAKPVNHIWQNIPSLAFKTGLYDGITTIRDAKLHGDFGVGQFAALDGELIVSGGLFYRARADGVVCLAEDADELCFAQLCYYRPHGQWDAPSDVDDRSFGEFLSAVLSFRNSFCAFRIVGTFAQVVATAPPALTKPYPKFDAVPALRKSFPARDIEGSIVGLYSPVFEADDGIPGYHFHFVSDDGRHGGHVTSFSLKSGYVDAARIDDFVLTLPNSDAYDQCVLG
jgi:acetolactate decarboxylase